MTHGLVPVHGPGVGDHCLSVFTVNNENVRVQVEVDALVGGDVPLQCKQNIIWLPQVPAQNLWILKSNKQNTHTRLGIKRTSEWPPPFLALH